MSLDTLLAELNAEFYKAESNTSGHKSSTISDFAIRIWSNGGVPPTVEKINAAAKDTPLYLVVLNRYIWADNLHLHVALMTKEMLMEHAGLSDAQVEWLFINASTDVSYWWNRVEYKLKVPVYRSRGAININSSSLRTESAYEFYIKQRNMKSMPQ